jgi:formylglycine-generating enzyme required for sulfatase activity
MRALAFALSTSLALPAQAPAGMVLVPAGVFTMGRDGGNFDEAPAHRVRLSAFYLDRCEVTNAQFAAYVRAAAAFDHVAGPWFRHSAEGCLDLLAQLRQRHGDGVPEAWPGPGGDEAKGRQHRRDAARFRAALLALQDQLPGHALLREGMAPDPAALAADAAVRTLVTAQQELPVRLVTWHDAAAFARHAGKRLPTEAEWEYAARGGDGRGWPWGDEWREELCVAGRMPAQSAVYDPYRFAPAGERDAAGRRPGPAPVGSLPAGASPFGVLDLAGNVWEWTADWYGERSYAASDGAVDPQGPAGLPDGRIPVPTSDIALLRDPAQGRDSDTRKVLRGGGWAGPAARAAFDTRTTTRLWSNPYYWHDDTGFRCARDVDG